MIELDLETHVYRLDGRVVPGVTDVLSQAGLNDFDRVPPSVLAAAAAFGRNVHEATHLYDRGELDLAALDPALAPYVQSWAGFIETSGAVVIASEVRCYSQAYDYAGTLDRILEWKGEALVDLKATAVVPRSVGPQTSAYAEARGARKMRRFCVHLQPDGSPARVKRLDDPSDFSIFLSALNIWKWRNRNAA